MLYTSPSVHLPMYYFKTISGSMGSTQPYRNYDTDYLFTQISTTVCIARYSFIQFHCLSLKIKNDDSKPDSLGKGFNTGLKKDNYSRVVDKTTT